MYFEAVMKDVKWQVEVFETDTHWNLRLQKGNEPKEQHHLSKVDYQEMDDAVCFLFMNNSYMVDVTGSSTDFMVFTRGSFRNILLYNDEMLLHESLKGSGPLGSTSQVTSGMPGKIVKIMCKKGDKVAAHQVLLVMEAMKMENDIKAPHEVTVKDVCVKDGESVESGAVLVVFEKE